MIIHDHLLIQKNYPMDPKGVYPTFRHTHISHHILALQPRLGMYSYSIIYPMVSCYTAIQIDHIYPIFIIDKLQVCVYIYIFIIHHTLVSWWLNFPPFFFSSPPAYPPVIKHDNGKDVPSQKPPFADFPAIPLITEGYPWVSQQNWLVVSSIGMMTFPINMGK